MATRQQEDRPQPGRIYALTGWGEAKALSQGNTWAESDVTEVMPCTARGYGCESGRCVIHAGNCSEFTRHECANCYALLST